MIEDQKRLAAQVFSAIYSHGQLDLIETIFHEKYVQKPIGYTGHAGLRRHVQELRTAFPDLSFELIDQIAENDGVVNLLLLTGTQSGPLYGQIAPTSRQVGVMCIIVQRFEAGKIVEGV